MMKYDCVCEPVRIDREGRITSLLQNQGIIKATLSDKKQGRIIVILQRVSIKSGE